MKIANYKFETPITIIPISDLHVGSKVFKKCKFKAFVDSIKDRDDIRIILNGDILDIATFNSKSQNYTYDGVENEINTAVKLLTPIKNKIIGVVSGNHEERTYKSIGLDVTKFLLKELDIKVPYHPHNLVLILDVLTVNKVRPKTYSIFITHGTNSNSTAKEATNIVSNADLYVKGHTHKPQIISKKVYTVENHHKKIRSKVQHICTNGAWLDYNNSYGQELSFNPTATVIHQIQMSDTITITTSEL